MPITQSRMLALLSAAQDYKQALDLVCQTLTQQEQAIAAGTATPASAWAIASVSSRAIVLLNDPLNSPGTIIAEALHFKANRKRNIRKAEKLRENRRHDQAGIPRPNRGPSTAPTRIYTDPPSTSLYSQSADESTPQPAIYAPIIPSAESEAAAAQFLANRRAEQQFYTKLAETSPVPETPEEPWAVRSARQRAESGQKEITSESELDFD